MAKRAISIFIVLVLGIARTGTSLGMSTADITHDYPAEIVESLQMMSSLGIMRGYGDGRLDPDGYLTRAQAAKLVYVARTGFDDNADKYKKIGFTLFADVPENYWGTGYINYLVLKGYAAGKGNGKFDPDGLITGIEYMKILLAALGYDPEIEGFTNNVYWKFNVIGAAVDAGLTAGYSGNPDLNVTRGDAALLTKNMIEARTVSYDKSKNRIFSVQTFGKQFFDLEKVIGVVAANEETDPSLKGKTVIEVPESGTGRPGTYSVSTKFEDLGKSVIIYTKGDSFSNIYGEANIRPINRIVTTYSELNDKRESDKNSLRYWLSQSGLTIGNDYPVCVTKSFGPPLFEEFGSNGAGEKLTAIDNDSDGKVDYMVKIVERAATVTAKRATGEGSLRFDRIPGNWNSKNVDDFSALNVGDVVLAYESGGKLIVRKAGSFTGKMTSCIPAYGKATIDGVLYGASSLAFDDIDGGETDSITFSEWIADGDNFYREFKFYLDGGGHIIFITAPGDNTARQYAYVLDTSAFFGPWPDYEQIAYARLLFEDGTVGVRRVGSLNGKLISSMSKSEFQDCFDPNTQGENKLVGKVAAFTSWDDDGGNGGSESLVALSTEKVYAAELSGNFDFGDPNLAGTGIYSNNRTVYVSYNRETGAAKTYTGIGKALEYEVARGIAVHENNIAKAVFLISASKAAQDPQTVFITGGPTITVSPSGKVVYTYPVFEDGKEGTLSVGEAFGDLAEGLYFYTVSEWGEYSFEVYDDIAGTVSIVSDGIVVVNSKAYIYDNDTGIYVVEHDHSIITGNMSDLSVGDSVMIVTSQAPDRHHADQIYIIAG